MEEKEILSRYRAPYFKLCLCGDDETKLRIYEKLYKVRNILIQLLGNKTVGNTQLLEILMDYWLEKQDIQNENVIRKLNPKLKINTSVNITNNNSDSVKKRTKM